MKKQIFALIVGLVMAVSSHAQSVKADYWVKSGKGKITQTGSVFASMKISEKLSYTNFMLVSTSGFAEAQFGLSAKIASNTFFGVSAGFQNSGSARFGSSFFTKQGSYSLLLIGEYGVDGSYWYNYYLKKTNGNFSFGWFGRRFVGHGLRIDHSFGKVNFWSAVTYDFEAGTPNTSVGVYVKF